MCCVCDIMVWSTPASEVLIDIVTRLENLLFWLKLTVESRDGAVLGDNLARRDR